MTRTGSAGSAPNGTVALGLDVHGTYFLSVLLLFVMTTTVDRTREFEEWANTVKQQRHLGMSEYYCKSL